MNTQRLFSLLRSALCLLLLWCCGLSLMAQQRTVSPANGSTVSDTLITLGYSQSGLCLQVFSRPTAYIARDTGFTQDVRQIPGISSCFGNASAPSLWFVNGQQLTAIPVQRGVTYYWKIGENGTRYSFTVASGGVLTTSPQAISSGWLLNNSSITTVNYRSFSIPYALYGSGLTAPITITAQSGALVANSPSGPFFTSLSLTPSSGIINTTLYAAVNPRQQVGAFSSSITHQSGTATATLQMTAASVNFGVYRSVINFGTVGVGLASQPESSIVIGGALSGNTTITAPTGFQVALSQTGPYQSSLAVPSVADRFGTPGYLSDTTGITLWIRCFSASAGTFIGNVTLSNPAASQNGTIAVSATVSPRTPLQQDSLALIDLYNSTGGASWRRKTNWLTSFPLTSWDGITIRNARVAEINLTSNNLRGALPTSIGNLSQLTVLALGDNLISNQFPASLGTLTNLQELYLWSNQLTGTIPNFINGLSSLRILELEQNAFTGAIPDFTLPNIDTLRLDDNQLSGTIPNSIGNFSRLGYLDLGFNQLNGTIPSFLGNLSNLKSLNLTNNQFTGTIPGFLGNLSNLSELYLGDNQLIGTIPSFLGNLSRLTGLSLRNNQLNGTIPSSLGNLRLLDFLSLHGNILTGEVPVSFNNLTLLTTLAIGSNQFTRLPDLSRLTRLDSVRLENNRFVFADIEPLAIRSLRRFTYTPQDSIGSPQTFNVRAGAPLTLTLPSEARAAESPNNQYQWFKNGLALAGQTSQTINKTAVASDDGIYQCRIVNPRAAQLILWTNTYTVNISIQQPSLTASVSALALGMMNLGTAGAAQSYTLTGTNLITNISIFAPSGVELSTAQNGAYSSTLTLAPTGGSLSATVFVRITAQAPVGTVSGTITHTSSGMSFANANVAVSGTVSTAPVAAVSASTSRIPYGLVRSGRDSIVSLSLRNTGTAAGIFSATMAGANAADFSLVSAFQGVRLGAGDSARLQIRFRPQPNAQQTAAEALRSATLQVRQSDGTAQADIALAGTAAQPAFQVNASVLNFGTLYTTQPALRQTLRITNIGTAAGEVSGVAVAAAQNDFSLAPFRRITLAVGASADVEVFFLPQSAGAKQTTLTASVEAADPSATTTISVALRGEGRELPAPTLITPFDGVRDVAIAGGVGFSWNASDNADSYVVQIARDRDFTRLVDTAVTTNTNYTLRTLERDAQYFWRVRARVNVPQSGQQSGSTTTVLSPWNTPKPAVFQTEPTPSRPRLRADTSVIDFGRVSVIRNGVGQGIKRRVLTLQALNGSMRLEPVRLDSLADVFDIGGVTNLNNTEFLPGAPRSVTITFKAPPPGRVYAANLLLRASPTDSSVVVLRGQGTLCVDTTNGRQLCPSTAVELRLVGRQPANPLDSLRFQVWLTNVHLLGTPNDMSRFVRRLRTTLSFTNNSMIAVRSVVAQTGVRATLVSPRTLPNRQNAYTVIWDWQNPREILNRASAVQLGEIVARTTLGDTNTTTAHLSEVRWLDADVSTDNAETTREIVVQGADTTLTLRTRYYPASGAASLVMQPPVPNPTSDHTTLTYTLSETSPVTIVLTDVLGRTLGRTEYGFCSAGEHQTRLELGKIPRGTYYVLVATPHTTRAERIEVKR